MLKEMSQKVIIFGSDGCTGSALINYLPSNYRIIEVDRKGKPDFKMDISRELYGMHRLFKETTPDQIYNVAGSFSNTFKVDLSNNFLATKNILDAIIAQDLTTNILIIGSIAEYGIPVRDSGEVREEDPLNPISIQGFVKKMQTELVKFYCQKHKINVKIARMANIYNENLSSKLIIGKIIEKIKKYKKGKRITLGNISARRDYLAVEDVVEAYRYIMEAGESGQVYNVGSGYSVPMEEVIRYVLKQNNLDMDIIDSNPSAPCGVKDIFVNNEKLKKLGWTEKNKLF